MKIYCSRDYNYDLKHWVGRDVWIKTVNDAGYFIWIRILKCDKDTYYINNIADEYVSQKHSWADVFTYAGYFINQVDIDDYKPVYPLDVLTSEELQERIKDNSYGVPTQLQDEEID